MRDYKQFSLEDRKKIYIYLEMKWPVSKIAQRLGRHRSAVYREIKRNSFQGSYIGRLANELCLERRRAHRGNKLEDIPKLRAYVLKYLKRGWSPEQIAGRLKILKRGYSICAESIYRYIYNHGRRDWYQYLAYKQAHRQKRYSRRKQEVRYRFGKSIHTRSAEANSGRHFGHWEGDTMAFSRSRRACVTTLVEKKTLYTLLRKNDTKASAAVMGKIRDMLKGTPKKLWKTLTFDQGCEFADFRKLEKTKRCLVYYCDAHSPWQRGCNENTNKRLRRYLPRDLDIENFTEEQVQQLNKKMNETPRKKLGYLMPKEALALEFKKPCRT